MPDAIFAHQRLSRVYDAFDGPRDDLAAYVGIAEDLGADRVLDVGCGTGCLAILLAGTGRTVVGVDPAAASLEVAKAKEGAAAVTWIHGDAAAIPAAANWQQAWPSMATGYWTCATPPDRPGREFVFITERTT